MVRALFIKDEKMAGREMRSVGVSDEGILLMSRKAVGFCIKLKSLRRTQALIIKQDALSVGADAAVKKGIISSQEDYTDMLIFGNPKSVSRLCDKLEMQQFGLKEVSDSIKISMQNFFSRPKPIDVAGRKLEFKKPLIMGIVNTTPDSFSDGGQFLDPDKAFLHAKQMVEAGADIIDVGGESTRPGSDKVTVETELKRVLPVIKRISDELDVLISIDTSKAEVARRCLENGAHIINDVSALSDLNMAKAALEHDAPVILMHMKGTPKTMQDDPSYENIMDDVYMFLNERVNYARAQGLKNLIIDPGIGFGKTVEDNYAIMRNLDSFGSLGLPILFGVSRKSCIANIAGKDMDARVHGTIACNSVAIMKNADIIRVHDIKEARTTAIIADAIRGDNNG